MKLVLLVLFSVLCSVQPSPTKRTVVISSGKKIRYENSSETFICKKPHAIWSLDQKNITECNCPRKCGKILFDKKRITAYCNGSSPVLHFKKMKMTDNHLNCWHKGIWLFSLHGGVGLYVGRKSDNFYPTDPFALVNNSYTLVCEKKREQNIYLYDDSATIAMINSANNMKNYRPKDFVVINKQSKITLIIKKVALKDDGKLFGCLPVTTNLSLINLTVNVPVSSVSLHHEIKDCLVEDEIGIFVCKVNGSKPKASFQWILFENGFEREITENIDITLKQNGKLWQTTSTLKLKLKRNFQTIKCRARIKDMNWTNSTPLPLYIKYSKASVHNTLVIILSSTIASLIMFIIISGGIIWFKYKSYRMKKKPANNNCPLPPIPKLEDEPTTDAYDDLKFDYENLEEQHTGNEPKRYTYLEILQKEDEPKEDTYDDIETQRKFFM